MYIIHPLITYNNIYKPESSIQQTLKTYIVRFDVPKPQNVAGKRVCLYVSCIVSVQIQVECKI